MTACIILQEFLTILPVSLGSKVNPIANLNESDI